MGIGIFGQSTEILIASLGSNNKMFVLEKQIIALNH